MDNIQTTEEVKKLILALLRLKPEYHEKIIKVINLLENNNPYIYEAVDKLRNGSFTRDEFFDFIDSQYQLQS